jgi:hypothetical protein
MLLAPEVTPSARRIDAAVLIIRNLMRLRKRLYNLKSLLDRDFQWSLAASMRSTTAHAIALSDSSHFDSLLDRLHDDDLEHKVRSCLDFGGRLHELLTDLESDQHLVTSSGIYNPTFDTAKETLRAHLVRIEETLPRMKAFIGIEDD